MPDSQPATASSESTHLVRNFVFIAADGALFGVAAAVVGVQTLVPAILVRLGASNAIVGLLPALMTFGTTLPPLFTAYLVTGHTRTKKYSLAVGVAQRLPWLFAGLAVGLAGTSSPRLVIAALVLAIVVFGTANGLVSPIWFDIVTRAIPSSTRGRMFAVRDTVSQLLTLAAGALVTVVLDRMPFPGGHSSVMLMGFGVFTISWICFLMIREVPHVTPMERVPPRRFLSGLGDILRRDAPFRRFVVARGLFMVANASAPFVTVFVLSEFGLPDRYVGIFAITTAAGVIASTSVFGALGDRRGHRVNFVIASIALITAGILALVANALWVGLAMFVMFAVARSAMSISGFNLVAEFCEPSQVSTYVAVASVVTSPMALASVALGVLADAAGFRLVFVAGSLFASAALVLFGRPTRRRR